MLNWRIYANGTCYIRRAASAKSAFMLLCSEGKLSDTTQYIGIPAAR